MKVLIYSAKSKNVKESVFKLQEFVNENYEDVILDVAETKDSFTRMVSEQFYEIVFYDIIKLKSREEVMEELQSFRLKCPESDVLLIAETEEHAITGYRIHAYDYIISSGKKEDLVSAFMGIMREKYSVSNTVYSVRMKGVWRKLELKNIVYLETNDHHVLFHMDNGQVFKKLANFNRLTPPIEANAELFQCHKSYVVNGRFIKSMVQNSFIMQGGIKVSISKPNRKNARNFYSWCVMKGYIEQLEETEYKKRP